MILLKNNNKVQDEKLNQSEQVGLIQNAGEEGKPEKKYKKSVEHEVDNSIFDLAFVSLLDPAAMDDW